MDTPDKKTRDTAMRGKKTRDNDTPVWQLSARAQALTGSAIRDIVKKISQRPEVISFAGGLPSPATFPVDRIRAAYDAVLTREGRAALQYSATDGYAPLRTWIAETLSTHGARIAPAQVLMVSGSQQGLDLLGKVLVNEGDPLIVETPTYVGALHALGIYGPRFRSVPTDDEGLDPAELPEVVRRCGDAGQRASFLYTIPTFQNPTGRTLSHARRVALVEEAARLKLLVVDDDPYRLLDHAGKTYQTLLSMRPESVVHLGSFSKILAPGIRLGYVVAPLALAQKLEQAKQGADLHTSTLTQMMAYEIIKDGFLDTHLVATRKIYAAQCAAMLAALAEHFPQGARWTRPTGGMFVWATLRAGIDAAEMLDAALRENVGYVPGGPFFAEAPQANTMRLSFATVTPDEMRAGIARLGKVIAAHCR
jgi:2-aminoadipate transaminase